MNSLEDINQGSDRNGMKAGINCGGLGKGGWQIEMEESEHIQVGVQTKSFVDVIAMY